MRKLMADWVEVMKNKLKIEAVKSRLRNSEKLKIGVRALSSTNTKSTSDTRKSDINLRTVGSLHPTCGS